MKFAYLLIMLFTLSYPLYKSFENKVHYYSKWNNVFKATLPVALLFMLWDNWFTSVGIWSFNEAYVTGIHLFYLPIEEYMFFLFVPFSCLFIHEVLYYFVKKDVLGKYAQLISWILILFSFSMVYISPYSFYTLILFAFLGFYLLVLTVGFKPDYMGRFYLTFLICIVPFLLVNGLLTGLPIVIYNEGAILGIRIFTIPIEDLFYGFLYLLMITGFYEYFKNRQQKK